MTLFLPETHWITAVLLDRMLYCLAEGTVLALGASLVLRAIPRGNSHTRFVVHFFTLLAIAVLPLIGAGWSSDAVTPASQHALVRIPVSLAGYIILGWMLFAAVGLARVAVGLWQIRALRRNSTEIDLGILAPEVQGHLEELRKARPVSVRASKYLRVPTAVGFFRPCVILPEWLVDQGNTPELNHAVLHELAHLRRRDDWTNLAQKLVKAVLFFHPGVWWIEHKLALDREMACDDAVLAQTASAQLYAQSLARVAEMSFLRRKLALAQAAVDRLRHLSLRVAQILDKERPHGTRLWKPALPMVTVIAVFGALSTSTAPRLVRLTDQPVSTLAGNHTQISATSTAATAPRSQVALVSQDQQPAQGMNNPQPVVIPALYTPPERAQRKLTRLALKSRSLPPMQARDTATHPVGNNADAKLPAGTVVVVVQHTELIPNPEGTLADGQFVAVRLWEVRWYVPVTQPTKQVPRKT
jgi:beta-lactamase regulating signal transducer with metallopeptidase domain